MSQDKYTAWEDIVRRTARFVARDFPDVDAEDLFQDLMVYVLENNTLKNPDGENVPSGLYKKGVKLAWEYRKQSLYITSQYSYRTSDVKKILETVFDHLDWDKSYLPDDAKSQAFDDKLVVNSDVAAAFKKLSPSYQEEIYKRYLYKTLPDTSTGRSRLAKAIERLADILNFYNFDYTYGGPGNRRVINNAKAGYIIREQYGSGD